MICFCNQVTEREVKALLKKKPLYSFNDVQLATKAGTSCGRCHLAVKQLVDDEISKRPVRQMKLF